MIEPRSKWSFSRAAVLMGVVLLSAVLALAQAPAPQQRSDGQIEMDVVHALDASKALKSDLITAATIKGEVTLAGTVSSDASRELAESIVQRVSGVLAVHNNLQVGSPQAAEAALPPPHPDEPPLASEPPAPASDDGPNPPPQAYSRQQAEPPPPSSARMPYVRTQFPDSQPPPPDQPGAPQPGSSQAVAPPPPPPQPAPQPATGPVTLAPGTLLQLRTDEPVSSKQAKAGQPVQLTLIRDVVAAGVLALPRGATVHGEVAESTQGGAVSGTPELALRLTSIDLGGQNYPLESDLFLVKGPNKAGRTVGNAVTGGLLGTIIGCAAGGGTGCAIGAGAGVAAGTAASAATSGPGAWIPAEARVDFHLIAPVTVEPVNPQEALRLSQGLNQSGGPTLNRRGSYGPNGYPQPGYPPYPPVFFRPYYVVGGYHSWR